MLMSVLFLFLISVLIYLQIIYHFEKEKLFFFCWSAFSSNLKGSGNVVVFMLLLLIQVFDVYVSAFCYRFEFFGCDEGHSLAKRNRVTNPIMYSGIYEMEKKTLRSRHSLPTIQFDFRAELTVPRKCHH